MRTKTRGSLFDKILRVVAAVTVVLCSPVFLIAGVMAADSGSRASLVASLTIIGVGGAFILLVLIGSINRPPRGRTKVVRALLCLAAIPASIAVGRDPYNTYFYVRPDQTAHGLAAPVENPHPSHVVHLTALGIHISGYAKC